MSCDGAWDGGARVCFVAVELVVVKAEGAAAKACDGALARQRRLRGDAQRCSWRHIFILDDRKAYAPY